MAEHSQYTDLLREDIVALTGDHPKDAQRDARLPALAGLSDDQIHVLLDLVTEEGLARGFGSWWWE